MHRTLVRNIPLIFILLGLAVQPVYGQTPPPDPDDLVDFYGINFIQPYEPWLSLAQESGAGVVRWQFNWRDHEPSPGQWIWNQSDENIASWNRAGIDIHAIMHFPPEWALEEGSLFIPKGLSLPWSDSGNGWAQYCYRFAERYKGQIASYEIWNEPDLNNYWDGTPEQYYLILRSCYQAIKSVDPNVPVIMAGMALFIEPTFLPRVVQLAATDPAGPANNFFFDAAAIHMYADPGLAYDLTVSTRKLLDDYGLTSKAIWITETNIALHPSRDSQPNWEYATEEEAGWYMLQVSSNALAAGADRLMIFRMADDGMDKAYGLVRNDATVRPSYESFRMATIFMRDIVEAEREERENNVVVNTLRRSDGARIILAYSEAGTPQTVSIPASSPAGVLINAGGGYSTVEPGADGSYSFTLLPARGRDFNRLADYTVGGPPVMIVEADSEAPVVTITFEAVRGSRTQALIKWEGDDGEYGTGVRGYQVQIKRDDGPWEVWIEATTETEAIFDLAQEEGTNFAFRSIAADRAGNISEPSEAGTPLTGRLTAQITDFRGQAVPFARVELADGTLHDADESGVVIIDYPPGVIHIDSVDGSGHGTLNPLPVEVNFGSNEIRTWQLLPLENAISNSGFDAGLTGWDISSGRDAYIFEEFSGQALILNGSRRPYGAPSAELEVDIPSGYRNALVSFQYALPGASLTLRLRSEVNGERRTLWQTDTESASLQRATIDLSIYAGQTIKLRFDLAGPKGTAPGDAIIDNVYVSNVPVLP